MSDSILSQFLSGLSGYWRLIRVQSPGFWLHLLRSQLFNSLPVPKSDFSGLTICVTGSSAGIGVEAARYCVALNAKRVILAVRNLEKGEKVRREIEASTGRSGVAEVWLVDFSNYESIKQFASRINSLDRLDAIIENAGVLTETFVLDEGTERNVNTNVISTYLLALLVLPKLKETAQRFNLQTHLSTVGSFGHSTVKSPSDLNRERLLESLNDEKSAKMLAIERYCLSKLMSILCLRELAASTVPANQSTKDVPVIMNHLNPGYVVTDIFRDLTGFEGALHHLLLKVAGRTSEQAARTLIYAISSSWETHGKYLEDCRIGQVSNFVDSEEGQQAQKNVWREVLEKLESIQPGITSSALG